MNAFIFYFNLIVLSIFPLITILASGGAVELFSSRFFASPLSAEVRLARVIAWGIIWTAICFGVALLAIHAGYVARPWWSAAFLLISVGFFVSVAKICPQYLDETKKSLGAIFVGVLIFACMMQMISVVWFPNVMDSTQLGWTNRFTDSKSIEYGVMNGAVGYSGVIFFVGLLAPHLPLAVSAASSKILLYFLLGLLCLCIARVFYGKNRWVGVAFVGCLIIGSSFGLGLFAFGKDSLLGVLFSLLYFALFADEEFKDDYRASALLCGLAGFTGVVTVPYMAIAAGLFFLLIKDVREKLLFAGSHLLIAGPLLAFPLQGMAKLPCLPVALGMMFAGLVVLFVARWKALEKIRFPTVPVWVPVLILLGCILASIKLMPVLVILYDGTTPIMPPLDGKTGFLGLLYNYSSSSGLITNLYLLAPFAALWFWRKRDSSAWVPFFFLPVALCFYLKICNTPQTLLTGTNQWDLVKNTINYFLAPIAAMSLGPVVAQAPFEGESNRSAKGFVPFIVLVMAGSFMQSVLVLHSKLGILYPQTRYGVIQQSCAETAWICDFLWRKDKRLLMFIDADCGISPFGNLQYLAPRTEMSVEKNLGQAVCNKLNGGKNTSALVLTNQKGLDDLQNGINIKILETNFMPKMDLIIAEVGIGDIEK